MIILFLLWYACLGKNCLKSILINDLGYKIKTNLRNDLRNKKLYRINNILEFRAQEHLVSYKLIPETNYEPPPPRSYSAIKDG